MRINNARSRGIYLAVLCILTYGIVYLCRLNISVAVEKMADGFGTSVAAVGIFGSLQSLIYACGQFFNGYFISRWRSRYVIGLAALGSGLANVLMGTVNGFIPALILWCINAYLQSLFWGSIIRVISTYPESQSSRSLMWLMMILPICTIISWSVIGAALDPVNDWHPYFIIPGCILLLVIPFWFSLHKICPETESIQKGQENRSVRELVVYMCGNGVIAYCVIALLHGAISGGVYFWAPLIIERILTGRAISPYLIAAIIPFVKIPSCLMLPLFTGRSADYRKKMIMFFGLIALFCMVLLLFSGGSQIPFIVLMTVLTFFTNLIGSMMSLYVPLNYSGDNMGAPVAGVLDSMIYIGSAVSTYVLGHIISSDSLSGAAVFWMFLAAAAVIVLYCVIRKNGKKTDQ